MAAEKQGFYKTSWGLVVRAAGEPTEASRAALKALCEAYRAPLLAIARRLETDRDRAEDLLQGFFATRFLEQWFLRMADQARGRFRTFLRAALYNYALNVWKSENRPGRRPAQFVDVDAIEVPSGAIPTDRLYDRIWGQALLDRALARLGALARPGKRALFEALRERIPFEDNEATLKEIAASLGMTENAVKVSLFRLRKSFSELVRQEVAETLAGAQDVDAELHVLRVAWREEA